MKLVTARNCLLAAVCGVWFAGPVYAQSPDPVRVRLLLEGGTVWQERNDVRIPPATGTEFSIADLIGRAPTGVVRAELWVGVTERQALRFAYAPLRLRGSGRAETAIVFAHGSFAPGPLEAEYQFSSFRGTWRYRVYRGPTWTWHAGVTAFVRDARIALTQSGSTAEDTDVGFVPLGYLSGEARLAERWSFGFEVDGSAAPQGRAFDIAATINYRPRSGLTLSAGYRTIEGGADVDAVYTFAWLNAGIVRLTVGF